MVTPTVTDRRVPLARLRLLAAIVLGPIAPLWSNRSARTRKWLRRMFWTLAFYAIGSGPAWAGKDPSIKPTGIGGLITVPDMAHGRGKTLFEAYPLTYYNIYTHLGSGGFLGVGNKVSDAPAEVMGLLYSTLELLAACVVRLAVGLTWWYVQLTGVETGAHSIGKSMQSAATELNGWLLPTALGLGAVIAYIKARTAQDGFSQLLTVIMCGIGAIALSISGATLMANVDHGRVLLSNAVNVAGGQSISTSDTPFKQPGTDVKTGDAVTNASRAEGDAVWRSLYVVPWCQVQFGSQQACKEFGHQWLPLNNKERQKLLDNKIKNRDKDAYNYIEGKNPADRFGAAIGGLVIAVIGAIMIGLLALFALMPWILAMILMYLAVVFFCLACIPGKTRQWAADYFSTLAGLTITSALSGGILAGMLLAVMAAQDVTETHGWLPGFMLTLASIGGAWFARKKLEQILGGGGATMGMGGMFASMLGGKMLGKGLKRLGGAVKSKAGSKVGSAARSGAGRVREGASAAGQKFAGSRANLPGSAGRYFRAKAEPVRNRAHGAVRNAKKAAGEKTRAAGGKFRDSMLPWRAGGATAGNKGKGSKGLSSQNDTSSRDHSQRHTDAERQHGTNAARFRQTRQQQPHTDSNRPAGTTAKNKPPSSTSGQQNRGTGRGRRFADLSNRADARSSQPSEATQQRMRRPQQQRAGSPRRRRSSAPGMRRTQR